MDADDLADLMAEPPGGENHGRVRTEGGWRSLAPAPSADLPYIIDDPEYRAAHRYEHGTRARYVHDRCRCALCRKANRDYMRKRRSG